jgi:branched-chain amino acid transport system ATP-binding protein
MTIEQNVKVGAHFGNRGQESETDSVAAALEFVHLTQRRHLQGDAINLFDKKRTMLAAALATSPKLLLLDEPVGGLSPDEIPEFVALIREVHDNLGISILVIEHLMSVLTDVAERMMILDNGAVIAIGTPEDVCGNEQVISVYLGTVADVC